MCKSPGLVEKSGRLPVVTVTRLNAIKIYTILKHPRARASKISQFPYITLMLSYPFPVETSLI